MVITLSQLDVMIEQARVEFPNEACGMLASADGKVVRVYPTKNVDASPVHYTIDSAEQLRIEMEIEDQGWRLGAIYHSHTHTAAYPSKTDIGLALVPGTTMPWYPDTLYIIISLADADNPDVRAFSIGADKVIEQSLEIVSD